MIKYKILKTLEKQFGKNKVFIHNESKKHNLLNRPFSHFKIIIISDKFIKKSLIIRHKEVYTLLSSVIDTYNIHGISIHTYTKEEFKNMKNNDFKSPHCIKK
ncbi:BolA/IbaG family iron-sulfur metabolism protein [Buchnera aphidicola]|uniref:BolA/IbaG family iron-sulfur metabolism protein n=1 Tax=Buchnera aphidicola TaxID=9 RepID=UPI003463D370